MNYIQYGNRKINFEIKRGIRKKTVAIEIDPLAKIIVSAPHDLQEEKLLMIVQKKARWIVEKQEIIKNGSSNSIKEFVSGESFPYLGKEYRLKLVRSAEEKEGKCELKNNRFYIEVNKNLENGKGKKLIKEALMDWYLLRAEEKIRERANYYSRQIGKKPGDIKIKAQEKRWGSCSHDGILRFNWKIIIAPLSVLDYVIVHGLCHLIFPHHSSHFWQKMQSVLPGYKRRRELLKQYSNAMEAFGGGDGEGK